ncbi:MAG: DUF1653 domain-containing protein [Planctomycetota bacterium]|nr:MAG: DUF1653 domain-containing protein [Planctomycetota bacterium]REK22486.1 MAG: DUF1653 domain-containing protein [Planctomycetota bacterium]REK47128.1 MAG: DUF1653 domain-containing protein [Planctomycetota bacterium]
MTRCAEQLRRGRYRHFKGGMYRVEGVATHVDTAEEYVIYIPLYGSPSRMARPLVDFLEKVSVNGKDVPRFEFVGDDSGRAVHEVNGVRTSR